MKEPFLLSGAGIASAPALRDDGRRKTNRSIWPTHRRFRATRRLRGQRQAKRLAHISEERMRREHDNARIETADWQASLRDKVNDAMAGLSSGTEPERVLELPGQSALGQALAALKNLRGAGSALRVSVDPAGDAPLGAEEIGVFRFAFGAPDGSLNDQGEALASGDLAWSMQRIEKAIERSKSAAGAIFVVEGLLDDRQAAQRAAIAALSAERLEAMGVKGFAMFVDNADSAATLAASSKGQSNPMGALRGVFPRESREPWMARNLAPKGDELDGARTALRSMFTYTPEWFDPIANESRSGSAGPDDWARALPRIKAFAQEDNKASQPQLIQALGERSAQQCLAFVGGRRGLMERMDKVATVADSMLARLAPETLGVPRLGRGKDPVYEGEAEFAEWHAGDWLAQRARKAMEAAAQEDFPANGVELITAIRNRLYEQKDELAAVALWTTTSSGITKPGPGTRKEPFWPEAMLAHLSSMPAPEGSSLAPNARAFAVAGTIAALSVIDMSKMMAVFKRDALSAFSAQPFAKTLIDYAGLSPRAPAEGIEKVSERLQRRRQEGEEFFGAQNAAPNASAPKA
jgi:hypothetical protein